MRVPITWLADYVDWGEMTVDTLADRLTMAGLKVEAVERVGEAWRDIVVGEVRQVEPHPTSRKPLWVTQTDLGGGQVETIVTGASNVEAGDKVPVIPVGGLVPVGPDGHPFVIEPRLMAGITSQGMLGSADELGLAGGHDGIYILPADVRVGAPLRSVLGDDVIDIETNPNRPDTLSMIGIAREVAAITETSLTVPDVKTVTGPVEFRDEPSIAIEIEDLKGCSRYTALRIEGVVNGTSPFWLRRRLEMAGMRPISLLVDLTNYVMLEYGQPMHAFDAAKIRGGRIIVRRARPDEELRTLDGVLRTLVPDDLVIADEEGPIGLAGVMGGENSEIGPDTTAIVLESATFDPVSVRRTAKRLDLRSEASSRFEKGLAPEMTEIAARRFLQLLAQESRQSLAAARLSAAGEPFPPPRVVAMPLRDLPRLLGIEVGTDRSAEILSALGFGVEITPDELRATVPFWRRVDINLAADLVEEIARVIGYDAIPSTLPAHTVPPPEQAPSLRWEGAVRSALLAAGVNELVTHSLTSPQSVNRLSPRRSIETAESQFEALVPGAAGIYAEEALTLLVTLLNPPTRDRTMLRPTLLPSLLDEIARNLRHSDSRVAFFEIARTYFRRPEELPYERRTLAIALSGRHLSPSWQDPIPAPYSFYDLKGMVESVFEALGIHELPVAPTSREFLHPGRAAAIELGGREVGYLGELHPDVAGAFEIDTFPVQVAEIDLDNVFRHASDRHVYRPIPRFPPARRDIAVVVARETPAAHVLRIVRQAAGELLAHAAVFDVYIGAPLPADRKSIAVALDFRHPNSTLTQEEVAERMEAIVHSLAEELGATIRD
ncbi:MAG TPA: phenylalanine--tRNA ligase subunit beta [Chloroflexota bacterium]|nr:phenylalanine--tRNA ligase subunit beta [Chloroflexota bacterium]